MLIIIRNGQVLSPKAKFVSQVLTADVATKIFHVSREDNARFRETWTNNTAELASSASGVLMQYLLRALKSPAQLSDSVSKQVLKRPIPQRLSDDGFLSAFRQVLGFYFAQATRTKNLTRHLGKTQMPKIFLVDEFVSLNIIKLKTLRKMGFVVYVSQDIGCNHFRYANHWITKNLMYRLEQAAVRSADLVVACSARDKLKYEEMGAEHVVFYPNVYPVASFEPAKKDADLSVSVVLHSHWGPQAEAALDEILKAISYLGRKIKLTVVGIKPQKVPDNIEVEHHTFVPQKVDYLKILSKSWIGINVGMHMGGSNERKYDYAMASCVVFSDRLGARGDWLPHEYCYVDYQDLATKLRQLLELGKERLLEMGKQNRQQVLLLAEKQKAELLKATENGRLLDGK